MILRLPAAIAALVLLASPAAWAQQESPSAPADAAAPETAPRIAGIRVEGVRRVEPGVVRAALQSKVGTPVDATRLEQDLQRVWKLGFFRDVQILLDETDPTQPVVVVKVEEKPAVKEVKIRGNKELSDDDLKDTVDIKPFSILDIAAVRRAARKVQEKYVEKGYYLADVEPVVEPIGENEVNVFLEVNEHAKVQVKRITLVGNQKMSDDEIKGAMQTAEGGFLSFITGSGTFREEVFQRDLAQIQGLYYDNGYIHVHIGQPQISLSADKRLLYLTIPITEGEQFRIGTIDFTGDLIVPAEELRARTSVSSGELFNRSKLQRDIMALTDVYYDAGYAYANITPQTAVDAEKRIVDLAYDVQKGEKVYIERIEIAGNMKTRDKVIRREMRVYEGELFSGTGLRLSRQRVTALGFFETVDVNFKRGSRDNTVVVNVTVKEKPTGTFQVGLGFSSVENFLLTAQISQNNLFGWGQTASLAAQISSLRSLLQLSYADPYFLDTNWIFSFNLFRQDLDYFGFIRRSAGGDVTLGYHLTDDLMVNVGYGAEDVGVTPGSSALGTGASNPNVMLANRFRNGLISSVRLTLQYDRRDNRLFPTAGNYQSVTFEDSTPWLLASFKFQRYLANSRWYQPLPLGIVAKAQGTLGFINGSNLPISELFFVGGINSLRGYQLRSIAPTVNIAGTRAPDSPLFAFPVGGNKELIFNFELEFPIFEKAGIRGVVFYDAGNVYAENQGLFSQNTARHLPLGLLHSAGLGLRWFSPIGPLRFEIGFPLTPRPGDQSSLFEFTIGNFF